MADFLRLIDVNAGGLRLKKGQGILHLAIWVRVIVCLKLSRDNEESIFAARHLDDLHGPLGYWSAKPS